MAARRLVFLITFAITSIKAYTIPYLRTVSDSTCPYTYGYIHRSNTSVAMAADDGYFECDSLRESWPRQSVKRALPRRDVTEGDGVSQQNTFPNESGAEEIILSKIEKRLQVTRDYNMRSL